MRKCSGEISSDDRTSGSITVCRPLPWGEGDPPNATNCWAPASSSPIFAIKGKAMGFPSISRPGSTGNSDASPPQQTCNPLPDSPSEMPPRMHSNCLRELRAEEEEEEEEEDAIQLPSF